MEIPIYSRLRKMEPSLATLFLIVVGAVAIIGFFAAVSSPVGDLLGQGSWRLPSTFHGIAATIFVLGLTIALYLAWRMFTGEIRAFRDLKYLAVLTSVLSAFTIAFGNWIYIAYRAPGGPREEILASLPAIHRVFFEFKEYMALFTFPLIVAATFALWSYDKEILKNRHLRAGVAVAIGLAWVYMMIAYVLGAAITKLAPV